MQTEGKLTLFVVQNHSNSIIQLGLQPSPAIVLLSSHC